MIQPNTRLPRPLVCLSDLQEQHWEDYFPAQEALHWAQGPRSSWHHCGVHPVQYGSLSTSLGEQHRSSHLLQAREGREEAERRTNSKGIEAQLSVSFSTSNMYTLTHVRRYSESGLYLVRPRGSSLGVWIGCIIACLCGMYVRVTIWCPNKCALRALLHLLVVGTPVKACRARPYCVLVSVGNEHASKLFWRTIIGLEHGGRLAQKTILRGRSVKWNHCSYVTAYNAHTTLRGRSVKWNHCLYVRNCL